MQTSESFRLSALLSFSGGLQDAYTYNVRGNVFANAQTGNIVLMSQNFLSGNIDKGIHYLFPVFSFALGVFITDQIEYRLKNSSTVHWRQVIIILEIIILTIVGLIPKNMNMFANMLVSLSCAMQVQAFRKVNGYGYASTMCIGNLRTGTHSLSRYFITRDKEYLKKAIYFFGIIMVFAIGAAIGGVLSKTIGLSNIWFSSIILFGVNLLMLKEYR